MRALLFLWVIQGFAAFNLTWGMPAVSLDANPASGDTDVNATVAIDPNGNAIASWGRTAGQAATEDIWAACYNHSSRTWTGAVKISGGGSASNSRVVMDPNGNAIVIWEEGFPTQIQYRAVSASGVWTPPLSEPPSLIHESAFAQTSPQIVIDSQGNALAIWLELSEGLEHLMSAQRPAGMGWVYLEEVTAGDHTVSILPKALSMNEKGEAIVVWQEQHLSKLQVHGAQFKRGTWLLPLTIGAEQGVNCQDPAAGIDGQGHCVVVWNQKDIICSKTIIDGIASENTIVVSNPSYSSKRPDVGVDAQGNAVVVFERYDSLHKFISGATLPFKAASWSNPVDISTPSLMNSAGAGYPVLTINAIGDGVVIWKEYNGSNMTIQGAGYSLGTWSFTKTLSKLEDNAGAPYPAYDIDVALNVAGNIIAIWPEDPSGNGAQQIKATSGVGLANTAPPPPAIDPVCIKSGIATGTQVLHQFPAHCDLINILNWSSPGGAAHYRIYRGSLSNLIGISNVPHFEDHRRVPKQQETYLITSVDSNGQESCPTTLIVHPL